LLAPLQHEVFLGLFLDAQNRYRHRGAFQRC
jgi:hypothetical protein